MASSSAPSAGGDRWFFEARRRSDQAPPRRIAIAADLSVESAFTIRWAVQNYLLPGDHVVLLHVRRPTYGVDADGFSASLLMQNLQQPLVEAKIPFEFYFYPSDDTGNLKRWLCSEARLHRVFAMVIGTDAKHNGGSGRLKHVIDYCVEHCFCPVVVVHDPYETAESIAREAARAIGEETMLPIRRPSTSTSSTSTSITSTYFIEHQDGDNHYFIDTRLETWDDPTPRGPGVYLEDLREVCVAAFKREFNLNIDLEPKYRTREERIKDRDEHERNDLIFALAVYANRNNIQPSDLEFVEVKERNLIDESGKGFVHFNFSVKGFGKSMMFFAELHPDLKSEEGVYLCTPLKEGDEGLCHGCKERAKGLIHPTGGGILGGHKEVGFTFFELSSDEDDL